MVCQPPPVSSKFPLHTSCSRLPSHHPCPKRHFSTLSHALCYLGPSFHCLYHLSITGVKQRKFPSLISYRTFPFPNYEYWFPLQTVCMATAQGPLCTTSSTACSLSLPKHCKGHTGAEFCHLQKLVGKPHNLFKAEFSEKMK